MGYSPGLLLDKNRKSLSPEPIRDKKRAHNIHNRLKILNEPSPNFQIEKLTKGLLKSGYQIKSKVREDKISEIKYKKLTVPQQIKKHQTKMRMASVKRGSSQENMLSRSRLNSQDRLNNDTKQEADQIIESYQKNLNSRKQSLQTSKSQIKKPLTSSIGNLYKSKVLFYAENKNLSPSQYNNAHSENTEIKNLTATISTPENLNKENTDSKKQQLQSDQLNPIFQQGFDAGVASQEKNTTQKSVENQDEELKGNKNIDIGQEKNEIITNHHSKVVKKLIQSIQTPKNYSQKLLDNKYKLSPLSENPINTSTSVNPQKTQVRVTSKLPETKTNINTKNFVKRNTDLVLAKK